jgi:hypothetical protein
LGVPHDSVDVMTTARSLAPVPRAVALPVIESARAPHALGCTLHEDHEGDCAVARPGRSRFNIYGKAAR